MWRCGVAVCGASVRRPRRGRSAARQGNLSGCAARPCLRRDAGRLRRVGFAVHPAEAHWFCVFHRRPFMGGLRAAVFDEASSVGAADGCALHKRVGRNFAGVRRLGDDVLSLPLCVSRRFERKCASLCGWRLERCARVQGGLSGGLCAGPVARFREASETKQTFRRCAGAGCERWGGFAVRPMACASALHLRAGRLHERLGLRLHGSGLYGWVCGERAEADVADGCTWWRTAVFPPARGGLGTARFSLSLCARRPCQRKRGFLCERSLERCACGQGGVSRGFCAGAALRPPSFEERRNVLADGAARRVCGRAVGRRRACFRPRGSKSAAKRGLKNMN